VPLAFVLALLVVLVMHRPRATPALPPTDERLPTIVVDAGHGGHDSGALGNGLCEKDLTLDTALRLERLLRARGYPVVLTRSDDRFLSLYERSEVANELPNALFVSIHFNDNTTASGDGIETFYAAQKAAWIPAALGGEECGCCAFAQCVQTAVVAGLGATDRGARPRQLAVVRYARCPAVLVEGGFINNPWEARKVGQPEYREKLAASIAEGIAAFQFRREQAGRDARIATVK
jgi:N-acetylmuramoyl-L-alanine amidase